MPIALPLLLHYYAYSFICVALIASLLCLLLHFAFLITTLLCAYYAVILHVQL